MKMARKLIKRALANLGWSLVRTGELDQLRNGRFSEQDFLFLTHMPEHQRARLIQLLPWSRAQLRQDLLVLSALDFPSGGSFVEFGATNGRDLSNTWLLEKEFGWRGILAEPARCWHEELRANRSAAIETACIWRESGQALLFDEVDLAELSTIRSFSDQDAHRDARRARKSYTVPTLSLLDLLKRHGAPTTIDYLSIDTEGSEFDILAAFDFEQYRFRVITCEHNRMPARERILELLTAKGYRRIHESVSKFDDWYVHQELRQP